MQSEQQQASLEIHLQNKYHFLNQEEINDFIQCHNWLLEEKDYSIIERYLEEYFQGLATRYKTIAESIERMKTEKEVPSEEKKDNDKMQLENEGEKSIVGNFEEFLNQVQNLHQDLFELKNQRGQFYNIIEFLNKTLQMLAKDIKDPNTRQLTILDPQYKEDGVMIILNTLGYDIALYTETEIILILNTDPSQEFISILSDTIASLYLQNSQFLDEVNKDPLVRQRLEAQINAPKQRELDRASFLASRHEQRLNQANNQGSINTQANDSLLNANKSYTENSARSQIDEYRNRMRNKFLDDRKFSGNNSMTLSDLSNRERITDSTPKLPQQTGNKIITTQDIEKMRIEEDKVKFGIKCLELTNKFRASQGKPPLTWSQELCDVGMKHSKDMAEQKVPFGHHGFDKRCKQVKFHFHSMAENVAYNAGHSDPPKVAVDGWINSPGHRKNLLSNSNVCAISVYRAANGAWYFTQLFALKS